MHLCLKSAWGWSGGVLSTLVPSRRQGSLACRVSLCCLPPCVVIITCTPRCTTFTLVSPRSSPVVWVWKLCLVLCCFGEPCLCGTSDSLEASTIAPKNGEMGMQCNVSFLLPCLNNCLVISHIINKDSIDLFWPTWILDRFLQGSSCGCALTQMDCQFQ